MTKRLRFLVFHGGAIAFATAAKSLFGLLITLYVALGLEDVAAAGFMQLLALQSSFVTFISGAAYVRGALADYDPDTMIPMVRFQLLFIVITCISCGLLAWFFIPRDYLGNSNQPVLMVTWLLLLSAVLSAVAGMLQGLLVRQMGRARIFAVTIIGNIAGCITLAAFWAFIDLLMVASILLLVQLLIVAQLLLIKRARGILLAVARSGRQVRADWTALEIGLANTFFTLAIFVGRELWKNQNEAELVAIVFILIRVSDTLIQIPSLFLGSSISTLKSWASHLPKGRQFGIAIVTILAMLFAAFAALELLQGGLEEVFLPAVIAAQLLTDIFRLAAVPANLLLLIRRKAIIYVLATCSIAASGAGLAYFANVMAETIGLYILLITMAGGQLAWSLIVGKIYPEPVNQ